MALDCFGKFFIICSEKSWAPETIALDPPGFAFPWGSAEYAGHPGPGQLGFLGVSRIPSWA